MKLKDRIRSSIYFEIAFFIIIAAINSIILFVVIQLAGDKIIDSIYSKKKQIIENNEYYINDLQSYIREYNISSQNILQLDDWVTDNKQIYISIKKSGRWIFFSNEIIEEQNDDNYDISKLPGGGNYKVELADGVCDVFIVGLYSYKAYVILVICDLGVCVAIFFIIFMTLLRKKMDYVEQICNDIQILEGGNLDYNVNVKGKDELAGLAESLNDMRRSFKKQLQEIEKLTKTNKEIVTEMSHDLRTPLTAVLLYAEILKANRFESEEKRNECIEKIVAKMEHMKVLSDRLLEYSIQANNDDEDRGIYYAMSDFLLEGISDFESYLENQGFDVNVSLDEKRVRVCLDEEHMTRILDNIASNIIKHADRERVVLISSSLKDEHYLQLKFENGYINNNSDKIESHGIGIRSIESMMDKLGGSVFTKKTDSAFITILELKYIKDSGQIV